jgi:SAM-dependent methyltransferase
MTPGPAVVRLARAVFATGNTIRAVLQAPILAELLGPSACGVAADVGAGGGIHSCGMYTFGLLAPRCRKVVAIDYSPEYCALLRDRAAGFANVDVVRASGDRLPLASGSVDTLLCTEVLTYLPDDGAGLKEVARVLRPGGRAILSVPLLPEPCPVPGARRSGYTPAQLDALLAAAALQVERVRHCMFGLTRGVMRLSCPLWRRSEGRWSLPLLWVVHLERRGLRWGRPYDLIVEVRR